MITHKFEHPLNEKTRIYLRVEALLNQMEQACQLADKLQHQLLFRALFDLLDIFDQMQLKSELAKDIEKQRLAYRQWQGIEGVDQEMLMTLLAEIDEVHRNLLAGERFGQSLKEDRFLSTIRQRFNLPGGSCCFDLPALHYWLHLSIEQKIQDAKQWMSILQPLADALKLWLKLTRETGQFRPHIAQSGFYQSDAEGANILRLSIPLEYGVYPMISGHKNRFAIKFIDFHSGQASNQTVPFDLAICS
ncbi:cell division protein ZapD [Vibrio cincinnatiensis]|jgi:cell division protein ZapD|uniref:Cell division protein ZapD n=1 Tax=Vibrio cincinnatiensis DSM 19608 TaxID=1123491 RepID=A0A1T4PAJ0_VIBCI|nr:cell division protein ZapD [Vibrio cincinnatiensis]MCG3721753.1 cell division protein ZapD [Vibrio cincinnatiensis]MCG3724512.1 cell division protein ZapD [Vibrio cincinnatiensis]MCG3731443.1 cell division protein ZapD [Vibrio cincinnatiensis]MCG3735175.1 cell division protein ZapD [Vibrio cincinnatiensis]MCG3739138.1 cell division protein ZapD [Vibrio cincinnatiensis]